MSRHGDVQEQLVVELYVRDFTIAGPDDLGLRFATRLPNLVASNAGEHAS